jgi:hypothetical protein
VFKVCGYNFHFSTTVRLNKGQTHFIAIMRKKPDEESMTRKAEFHAENYLMMMR